MTYDRFVSAIRRIASLGRIIYGDLSLQSVGLRLSVEAI